MDELSADRGSDRSEIKHRIGDHRMDELFEEIRRYIAEASEAWETKIECVNI